MHLNFATADLMKSIGFYTTLLDIKPVKLLDDYALFVSENPGLELAIDSSERVAVSRDAHYGLCVDDVGEVEAAIARLERADLVASVEREQICCYANQTKVWTTDPDGRRWEIYTVHEETVERSGAPESCCAVRG